MKDSQNERTCMWVGRVVESVTTRAKQFHACDSSEIVMQTERMLVQASIHVNDNKCSLKSSRQHSYKVKHKKHQKWNTRNEKWDYQKIDEMNVPTTPRCNVGCQSWKVNVRNELCNV